MATKKYGPGGIIKTISSGVKKLKNTVSNIKKEKGKVKELKRGIGTKEELINFTRGKKAQRATTRKNALVGALAGGSLLYTGNKIADKANAKSKKQNDTQKKTQINKNKAKAKTKGRYTF